MEKPKPPNKPPVNDTIDIGTYVNEVVLFIEMKLKLFPAFLRKTTVLQNLPKTIEGENRITENLSVFLNLHEKDYVYKFGKQDNLDFHFINQAAGKGHRTYDMGIILANKIGNRGKILVIEAKRLPTPGSARTKEYVKGNLGGIERFKKEVHSQEIQTDLGLMIGYIQNKNANHWHNKVNEWIGEQIKESSNEKIEWFDEDLLKLDSSFRNNEIVTKYYSIHSRIELSKIKLNHYWITFN